MKAAAEPGSRKTASMWPSGHSSTAHAQTEMRALGSFLVLN